MLLPCEAALGQGCGYRAAPAVMLGPGRMILGAAGPGGTCRQMSVSPSLSATVRVLTSPGDVARSPLHFFSKRN